MPLEFKEKFCVEMLVGGEGELCVGNAYSNTSTLGWCNVKMEWKL